MTLAEVPTGERAVVVAIGGDPAVAQRLMEFGLLEGDTVTVVARAPLGDPLELQVGRSRVSVRRADAAAIEVRPAD